MCSEKAHAHALVLPFPAQGHINPMLQFSKRLVSKGIKTTFINTVYISKTMHANLDNTSINFETISDGFDDTGFIESAGNDERYYVDNLSKVGSKSLSDLIKKLEASGNPVNALIYDSFLTWSLDVAKEFGVISAAFSTQTSAVMNVYYHVYKGILQVPLPDSRPVVLPGLPELQPPELPSFVYKYGSYPGFTDVVLKQFSNIDDADWVVCNTFYELEEDVLNKWMKTHWRVITVGPTVPSMFMDKRLQDDNDYGVNIYKPDSTLCINWLNEQPKQSVVYVSMGSWSQLQAGQTEEIATALINSGFNFLWVVREKEKSKLPENFIEETSEKGLVVSWCPQLEVLAHDSTGCFVTHCGFNSVLEALSLGVPVVAMPQWTDQTTNAKFLEDVWGVGLRAERKEQGSIVTRESLEYCLKEILEGEKGKQIKDNAAKWKKLAKQAVDEGGSSDKNIDEFVAHLLRSTTSSS